MDGSGMLGIIGGSGLYQLPALENPVERSANTPFGEPGSPIVLGHIGATPVAFLARHGKGHRLSPTSIPYRANIHALRALGVTHLLSISAVGSLREDLPPRTAVLPDQIIDRTTLRDRTFFDNGIVAHVGLAEPFCADFRRALAELLATHDVAVHSGGAYVCIEGPQFSTRAESHLYRSWNASVIGMTAMPEARLAREAGLCYATLAMVTDFDVWHETEESVSVDVVRRVLNDNIAFGRTAIQFLAKAGLPACTCGCRHALDHAIISDPSAHTLDHERLLATLRWPESTAAQSAM